ncbi:MAG: putative protein ninG [Prokaryotic dsDNA virus sp.]|nr:MAG: putative protein ninG [Prokaryotic dsDNA virus sp.]|tara:strand:+ start:11792 stop:12199 length:408 start_codon:yes stop_codon:yes gene_type:complete
MKPKKKLTRKKVIQKLDKVFSQYTRAKYMDDNGYIECYTCRIKFPFNKIQAGHFMSRKSYSTRWEEMNVMPQCIGCNMFKQGKQYEFGKRLDADFGDGTADEMLILSKKTKKFTTFELEEMIDSYLEKLNNLQLL